MKHKKRNPDSIPTFLYHYQALGEPNGALEQRLRTTLSEKTIYCSRFDQLNDPFENNPRFDVEDFHAFAKTPAGAKFLAGLSKAPPQQTQQLRAALEKDPVTRAKVIDGIRLKTKLLANERWRIYCLSATPTNNLLWAHYGAGHSGICLPFDTRNFDFSSIFRVRYFESVPRLRLGGTEDDWAVEFLLKKSSHWEYEQEYRILARPSAYAAPFRNLAAVSNGHILKLPNGALRTVIVGCRGDLQRVRQILSECKETAVSVIRAVADMHSTDVTIPELADLRVG